MALYGNKAYMRIKMNSNSAVHVLSSIAGWLSVRNRLKGMKLVQEHITRVPGQKYTGTLGT